jgi:hypothetical protein
MAPKWIFQLHSKGINQPECEASHSSTSWAKFLNAWGTAHIPLTHFHGLMLRPTERYNFIKLSRSWETASHAATQELPNIL